MNLKYSLSDTEQEIMEVLWERTEIIKTRDLLELFNERGKNWKRQTLNTFLIRLEEMGLVTRNRSVVAASGTRTDFRKMQSRELLDELYHGSVSAFCMALTGRNNITAKEKQELDSLIEKMTRE